jgi:medium-chain acyl-[acyl-carrier-protein] hydrolase
MGIMQTRAERLRAFELWTSGRPVPPSNRLQLLCIPHAGAGTARFRSWVGALNHVAEVWPILLPGREGRWSERPLRSIASVVEAIADAMAPLFDRPVALVGHSMGGLIAFELARELERRRLAVTCLVVSAVRAPHVPDPDPIALDSSDERVLKKVRGLGGIPDEVLDHPELLGLLLPTLRVDLAMCADYCAGLDRKVSCPIVALGGIDDPNVPRAHLTAWSQHTTSRFVVHRFAGSHFFIFEQSEQVQATIENELIQSASVWAV